jgi:circadian clock protein KaiB
MAEEPPLISSTEEFERLLRQPAKGTYVLRLYVSGMTPTATRAIRNIKAICEERLAGRYELEVVDVYQQPQLAKREQIVAAPTLIKKLPLPLRRIIGDMSNKNHVLLGLELLPFVKSPGGNGQTPKHPTADSRQNIGDGRTP